MSEELKSYATKYSALMEVETKGKSRCEAAVLKATLPQAQKGFLLATIKHHEDDSFGYVAKQGFIDAIHKAGSGYAMMAELAEQMPGAIPEENLKAAATEFAAAVRHNVWVYSNILQVDISKVTEPENPEQGKFFPPVMKFLLEYADKLAAHHGLTEEEINSAKYKLNDPAHPGSERVTGFSAENWKALRSERGNGGPQL